MMDSLLMPDKIGKSEQSFFTGESGTGNKSRVNIG